MVTVSGEADPGKWGLRGESTVRGGEMEEGEQERRRGTDASHDISGTKNGLGRTT